MEGCNGVLKWTKSCIEGLHAVRAEHAALDHRLCAGAGATAGRQQADGVPPDSRVHTAASGGAEGGGFVGSGGGDVDLARFPSIPEANVSLNKSLQKWAHVTLRLGGGADVASRVPSARPAWYCQP